VAAAVATEANAEAAAAAAAVDGFGVFFLMLCGSENSEEPDERRELERLL
jgi:hypothetical protein